MGTKEVFHNMKGMLYLTTNRRFIMLYLSVPVEPFILWRDTELGRTHGHTVVDLRQMLILLDFITIFNAKVARVRINRMVILTNELVGFHYVVRVGCCCSYGMNVARCGIYASVHFHTEISLVALLGLVHLGVAGFFLVLGGSWSLYDCGIPYI